MKQFFGLLIITLFTFASCTKDNLTYTDDTLIDSVLNTRSDTMDCFEFVFPIPLMIEDSGTVIVNSSEEALALKDSFFGHVQLIFPVNIINSDNETVTINSIDELKELIKDCSHVINSKGGKGDHNKTKHENSNYCFDLVFPLNILFPDRNTTEYQSKVEMKFGIKEWILANPQYSEKPSFQFPIEILIDSETENTTVNSQDELDEIIANC